MLSSRPYLLRALHEWIVDSGQTPHLLVNAEHPGVEVPSSTVNDGRVILNVGPSAVRDLLIDAELVTFVARFGGVSQAITVPMSAVEAIYAKENGRGMMFPEDGSDFTGGDGPDDGDGPKPGKPNLKVVK
jgi:stringent starvation protein B